MDELQNGAAPAAPESTPAPPPSPSPERAAPATTEPKTAARPQAFDTSPDWEGEMVKVWNKTNQGEERNSRLRSPDGKFARQDGAATETAAVTDGGLTPDQPKAAAPEQVPPAPAIPPPQSWSNEAKARWAQVPPEVQQVVAQRETQVARFVSQFGQKAKELEDRVRSVEPLEQVARHYQEYFRTKFVEPHQAFHQLAAVQQRFDTDPLGTLTQLGFEKGIDLRPVFQQMYGYVYGQQQGGAAAPQPQYDPNLVQYLNQLGEETAQTREKLAQIEQAERVAMDRHLGGMIDKFQEGKPYFQHLRPAMATMLEQGMANTLEEAYEKAIFSDPHTRQWVFEQYQKHVESRNEAARKATQERENEQARAAAERGRRSGALPVRGNLPGAKARLSIDETLNQTVKKHYPDYRPGV